jgi:hypothetical protein
MSPQETDVSSPTPQNIESHPLARDIVSLPSSVCASGAKRAGRLTPLRNDVAR